jgi:hypothetical protein
MKAIQIFKILLFNCLLGHICFGQKPLPQPTQTAVLVVGTETGNLEEWGKDRMNEIANYLISKNITVYKFYSPNCRWEDIKPKLTACNIFVYFGHGCANCGLNGGYGGICITPTVTALQFSNEVQFKNKPLIILYNSCGAAGRAAGDKENTPFKEICKRTLDTALPYFLSGAGAYYASSWSSEWEVLFENLFNGNTLSETFTEVASWSNKTVKQPITNFSPRMNGLNMAIKGISGNGITEYSTAYIADPNFRLIIGN